MRIISGTLRGRRLHPPVNLPVRPTTDMAKEGLFNILTNLIDFEETDALDLYSGTGSIGFELVSRGCRNVLCVEKNQRCYDFISLTAARFGLQELKPVRADVLRFLASTKRKWDLIFADPPYDSEDIAELPGRIFSKELLNPGGRLILEHSRTNHFNETEFFEHQRTYGKVNFSFFVFQK